jgi:hypothetical protein
MNTKQHLIILGLAAAIFSMSACEQRSGMNTTKSTQSQKAAQAAKSVKFTRNTEIENLKRRLKLTGEPGKVGFITLLNAAGQPIMYTDVKGKVSSGGKRLTKTWRKVRCDKGSSYGECLVAAPGDEGTYGSSSPYIYFWDTRGKYHQWSGQYLYTDQPQRLRIEPLVVNFAPANASK